MNGYYPVMLKLQGSRCIVVGGGPIAERKVLGLLEAGADQVTVIALVFTPQLEELARAGHIEAKARAYASEDAKAARLLFASTDQAELNRQIALDGEQAGIWVNRADEAGAGTFINPSVVRRGELVVAVSASGASPALSSRIREELAQQYGPEYIGSTARLKELRERVKLTIGDHRLRREVLKLAAHEAPWQGEEDGDVEAWIERLIAATDRRNT
ncbi:bifunctional precorrin-2 dehydrogenase/sirohydrochlorin ferrochelatase [Paenibacillus sp. FSL H8-0537]|uniref:precorrin-2 dehydrogenase/sirohydrochlorin ferrochelatase family protein n=1 Tax=Paenibacillus sp. FSL H8-0537 TaxID=2921399 RepID=UPI0031017F28